MSNTPDEVSLEDIDKILAAEDPDFTKSLEEVRAVESDKNVVIEASAIDESMDGPVEAGSDNKRFSPAAWVRRQIARFKAFLAQKRQLFFIRLKAFQASAFVWLKTKPKEYFFYGLKLAKAGVIQALVPIKAFLGAPRIVQLAILICVSLIGGIGLVFTANLKGIWIPHIMEPILTNLESQADSVETYDPKGGSDSFYSAFPQELHEFLFKKMKVNLKRDTEHPNPMGAFEVVVDVDSKDTAVELYDREVEIHDHLQRLFEDELVSELETEHGKKILKGRIKKDLNARLTQGWIREVHFKTFVLKP